MTWKELLEIINEKGLTDPPSLQDTVTVYDASEGEYYPADTIVFEEADDVGAISMCGRGLDAGHMFLSINLP
ncbi:uncharacterized protein METZ01_LOCUS166050 [marine metagenome]|uniref:Uncharacterized protein n=1 Tax=marine metagenome TaxID=408172 RepID=A0A382BHA4_9ZZZZ|tara:strand:+ start:338 stop:553 length:216 start_codon:yes stop_codon:yes gene_type:complete